jgi:hypothetical protein
MDDASRRGGFSLREYELRVWDMAKHQLHPTALYVLAVVAGATRLLDHAVFQAPGAWTRQAALFALTLLGAWACFWSTLLRVAGLPSRTITVLVPAAVAAAVAVWFAFPVPAEMSAAQAGAAAALLVGPGAIAWPLTWRRWRRARREAAAMLEEARP